jgi:hypothetical protein
MIKKMTFPIAGLLLTIQQVHVLDSQNFSLADLRIFDINSFFLQIQS